MYETPAEKEQYGVYKYIYEESLKNMPPLTSEIPELPENYFMDNIRKNKKEYDHMRAQAHAKNDVVKARIEGGDAAPAGAAEPTK